MSGLARLTQRHGALCTGSDLVDSTTVTDLRTHGIPVSLEQTARTVPADCELLVISAAIKPDHPEVAEAQRRGVTVYKYAQLLGQLMSERTGLAIAGTHGKSSTTSVLSHILITAGLDPSFIVGATCQQIGGGWRVGSSKLLVAEACEFDRSFHNFHPRHAVILNIEEDHLDVYPNLDAIIDSFAVFAQKLPADGSLLLNHEMSPRLRVAAQVQCPVETIGWAPQADWRVEVKFDQPASRRAPLTRPQVTLQHHDQPVLRFLSPLPGEHMAYNACAAAVLASKVGAGWSDIARAIESFQGLDRRMQRLGERAGVVVVDDYGHHPTEIDVTLRALRTHYQPRRLICVFQPHQHSRTRFLLDQFAGSFAAADIIIIPDIYFVRDSEKERHAVRAADLVDRLRKQGKQAMHLYPFAAIVELLQLLTASGDLLVTMGAGDVWKVAQQYLSAGKQ